MEGTGLVINTIPPNDFGYYEMLNALVQEEPAEALDPEIAGQFAAIGIVKGEPFEPDDRMRKILNEAVAVGNAAGADCSLRAARAGGLRLLRPGFGVVQHAVRRRVRVHQAAAGDHPGGRQAVPATGARTLDSRTAFFYTATGITPAMCMRLTDVGSQYLIAILDADGEPFDGAKTYQVTLPTDIPAARFWSLTLYDNQTRSMLQTAQRYPAGRQPDVSRHPPPSRTPTAPPSSTSPRRSPTASATATGSRPSRQGLVRDPAALQPAPALLRQDLAAERDRAARGLTELFLRAAAEQRE